MDKRTKTLLALSYVVVFSMGWTFGSIDSTMPGRNRITVHPTAVQGEQETAAPTTVPTVVVPTATPIPTSIVAVPTVDPCDPYKLQEWAQQLSVLWQGFSDVEAVASKTPRIALSDYILQMRTIRREIAALEAEAPECALEAQDALVVGVDATIAAYEAFLAERPDAEVRELTQKAVEALQTAKTELDKLVPLKSSSDQVF